MVYWKCSPKKVNFRRKFENLFKFSLNWVWISRISRKWLKIFAKMIEICCFEPHFRIVYRNYSKEIERKFGNPKHQVYSGYKIYGKKIRMCDHCASPLPVCREEFEMVWWICDDVAFSTCVEGKWSVTEPAKRRLLY